MTKRENKMDELIQEKKEVPIEEMPFETFSDYCRYNRKARELNKKARKCIYKIKQCPEELHPKERIVFSRNDQPANPLPVYLSNEYIDFKKTLIPGETYDLPKVVISYLAKKGVPQWKWFTLPNGDKETRVSHMEPRFALRTLYEDVI